MSRILKRPMFKMGGSTNSGIMTGLVDRKGYSKAGAVGQSAREYISEFTPLLQEFTPKTQLPLGSVGAALVSGTPIKDALIGGYTDFTKKDDARTAGIKKSAVQLGMGQALKDMTPSTNVLKNRKTAIVNIKAQGLSLTEENIIKETARLNKLDEAGKDPSLKRLIASREDKYTGIYGSGSKARNHAKFDYIINPEIAKAGKVAKDNIRLKKNAEPNSLDYPLKAPGVYVDVDNAKVIEITSELQIIELPELTELLRRYQ